MELKYIVLKLNESFGNMAYGGFQGTAEIVENTGFKTRIGNAYYLNTDLQGKIVVVLPEQVALKLLPIGQAVTLINHKVTYHVGIGQGYYVLWSDDIVEIIGDDEK